MASRALLLLAAQATTLSASNYAADAPMAAPRSAASWSDEFGGRAIDATASFLTFIANR